MNIRKIFIVICSCTLCVLLMSQKKPAADKATVMTSGSKVYKLYCVSCHLADAAGVPPLNPPLINSKFIQGDKKQLIEMMIKGKTGPVEIDGDVYTNPMPPQVMLNDQQIADVLSYIRNSFGNKASMVTQAEVVKIRAANK